MKNQFLEVTKKLEDLGIDLDQFYVITIWQNSLPQFQGKYNAFLVSKLIDGGFKCSINSNGHFSFSLNYCEIILA